MELQIGSVIGDYEIVGILGAGGMGKVYKVRNTISDRVEAMKVLLPDLTSMPDLADRFLREIKLQASLVHPNIAQLHTAVRADNQLLMVMEFVDGETLEQRARKGALSPAQALDYIGQVLSALEFAHAHGVVHRDIKPANMMLTPGGVIKLMDFGIAKAAADQKLTMTGTTMGSVYYMSPEQIQGSASLDARADLYSVGVTLYELVTGKRPFDGESQYSIMAAHLEKTPVPPITLDPSLPEALNEVILLSVNKDPNGRFQSAAAFRNALSGVASLMLPPTQPMTAPAPVAAPAPAAALTSAPAPVAMAPQSPVARPKGKRWLWMSVGGVAAAAAIVLAIQFGPWKQSNAATPPAQTANVPAQQPSTPAVETAPAPTNPAPESTAATSASVPVSQPAPVTMSKSTPPQQTAMARPPAHNSSQAASQAPQQPVSQPAVQQPPQQAAPPPVQQVASAPAPGPSRTEVLQAREHLGKLHVRASSIQDSLGNLKSSMQSQGLAINAKFTQPAALMDTYLRSATQALNQQDMSAAKDYADKAERQIEILEKLLNL